MVNPSTYAPVRQVHTISSVILICRWYALWVLPVGGFISLFLLNLVKESEDGIYRCDSILEK